MYFNGMHFRYIKIQTLFHKIIENILNIGITDGRNALAVDH